MARLSRLVVPRQVHLVSQTAVDDLQPLRDAPDCEAFMGALQRAAAERGLTVHGYVLLPRRWMALATPAGAESFGVALQALSRWFGAGFNRRHARRGALWRSRFTAAPLSPEHVLDAMVYMEQAPVRLGIAGAAAEHPWSSARAHLIGQRDPLVAPHAAWWALGNTPFEREAAYSRLLSAPLAPATCLGLETTLLRGWPLAPPPVLAEWARDAGRRTQPLARGRRPATKTVPK